MQVSEMSDKDLKSEIDVLIAELERVESRLSELETEESKRVAKKQVSFPIERLDALFDYMKKWKEEEASKGEKLRAQVIETAYNIMRNMLDLPE